MSNAQHEISNEHQQRDEKERDGGASGEIASLNTEGEGKRGEGLRGVKRAAGGEDVDDSHISKGEDEAKKHSHAENGPHHGNDDLELRAPETGAIHGGGFGDVLGNGGAPGEKNDSGKRHETPAMHQEDGSDGKMWFAEPHGGVERLVKVQRHQHPTDDAIDGVQNPFPTDSAQCDRSDPWKQDQKANAAAAAERLFQGNGEDVGADDHDDLRADGENQGIADGTRKLGLCRMLRKFSR